MNSWKTVRLILDSTFFTFDEKIQVKFWSIHALIVAGAYECHTKLNPSIGFNHARL